MFTPKKLPFFKGGLDYSHIVIAVLSALLTISLTAGNYQNKIDNLIIDNKDTKVIMKELSADLKDLSIKVATLSQKIDDVTPK